MLLSQLGKLCELVCVDAELLAAQERLLVCCVGSHSVLCVTSDDNGMLLATNQAGPCMQLRNRSNRAVVRHLADLLLCLAVIGGCWLRADLLW
jgi:hypothetical protein